MKIDKIKEDHSSRASNALMASLIKNFDWSKNSLGTLANWAPTTRGILNSFLLSPNPSALLLGEDLILLYNDAFVPFLDIKHPNSLAKSIHTFDLPIWKQLIPAIKQSSNNRQVQTVDIQIELNTDPKEFQRFYKFNTYPVFSDDDKMLGVVVTGYDNSYEIISSNLKETLLRLTNVTAHTESIGELLHKSAELLDKSSSFFQWLVYENRADEYTASLLVSAGDRTDSSWQNLGSTVLYNSLAALRSGVSIHEIVNEPSKNEAEKNMRNFLFPLSDITSIKSRYLLVIRAILPSGLEQLYIEYFQEMAFRLNTAFTKIQLSQAEDGRNQILRQFLASAPVAIFLVSGISLRIELINERMLSLLGRTQDDLLNRPFDEVFNHDELKLADTIRETFRFGKKSATKDVKLNSFFSKSKPSLYVKFLFEPIKDERGFVTGVMVIVEDITEQVRARTILEDEGKRLQELVDERTKSLQKINDDLKKSEERFHKMTEEVQDYAILLLDPDGFILNWNNGAKKIKGYSEAEILSQNFKKFYSQEDRDSGLPEKLLKEAREHGRAAQEGWRIRKDGTRFWASVVITALHDAKDDLIGFSKVTRDLTERKVAEDRMKQYTIELENQNHELEQFAYVASHDLQEPLRKIRTFVDLVKHNLGQPEVAVKYFEKIESAAMRMSELVRSILNYSRLSVSKEAFVNIDLNDVLKEVLTDLELLTQDKKAQIVSDTLPVVLGSMPQLHQLFLNLIGNALKFSSEKPLIEIHCTVVESENVPRQEKVANGKTYYLIRFKDNGIGFAQKYAEQIFTIFQRLHSRDNYEGTGIGLAICRRIIDNHHGIIMAKSELGVGSEFLVYLPC